MSIDGYRVRRLTPDEIVHRDHDLTNCHDVRHTGLNCPACDGVKITCRTHKTSSAGSAKTDTPLSVAVEARTPGAEVEPLPAPSRPAVNPTDRVTTIAPFDVDRTITSDDIHLVTFALTDDAALQLARDLERHSRDLITLWRLMQGERKARRAGFTTTHHAAASRQVMDRLAGALTSHATTQWELTLTQAEQLLEDLDDAATEPEACAVGTCTGYASAGSYCSGHADGI